MSHVELEKALQSVPFLAALGVRVEDARPGKVVLRLPAVDANRNFAGVVQSGAVFSVGELAAAVAVKTHPHLIDVELLQKGSRIRYHSTSSKDLTAHAEVTREQVEAVRRELDATGRAQLEVGVHVLDGHGNDVAELHGTFALRYR